MKEFDVIVDRLLEMKPDPIPRFVLLKEFKRFEPGSLEYESAYEKACFRPHIKSIEESQNSRGFWTPFHSYTEDVIRRGLAYGLDRNHVSLKRAVEYLSLVLRGEESWDQYERHDNSRYWSEVFMPLVSAAMLSLIDPENEAVAPQRQLWASFAKAAFADGAYNAAALGAAQSEHFGFPIENPIPPFNYYSLILLAPLGSNRSESDPVNSALTDYLMTEAKGIDSVTNRPLSEFVPINTIRMGERDFWHWLRALSLTAQLGEWDKYREKYIEWIMDQRNRDGLWEFPRKHDFMLSDSWRGKNKAIDSTIMVLRLLSGKKAY